MQRCAWCKDDELYQAYHDHEWGVPVYDERLLFEFLNLEGMQAGLSWITILKKREHLRKVFAEFDAEKLLRFNSKKIDQLLQDPGIIRSSRKINAVINNARQFLELKQKGKSFVDFIWQFTDGEIVQNRWREQSQVPTKTKQSEAMAKELKRCGFQFVGATICYAYMQAVGLVNDHVVSCYRFAMLNPKK